MCRLSLIDQRLNINLSLMKYDKHKIGITLKKINIKGKLVY